MATKTVVDPRRQYKPETKADRARAIMRALTPDDLRATVKVKAALKAAKVSVSDPSLYKYRNEILAQLGGGLATTNGSTTAVRDQLLLVKKTADTVGGLAALKDLISLLERIRA